MPRTENAVEGPPPNQPHSSVTALLRHFRYEHLLNPRMRSVSQQFHDLAHDLAENLPSNAETTTCLRKLLEAKDCAVRSVLPPGV